eukprot:CAMPEP_0197824288 /NCGR_PEP_ID=MMETSP1437-20131217/1543_1 /TAXON_ID=49252 ORGANISM="Eucampia antarctica, Strain CCMP1452" /NCGR_SAMPLE_ID=MMETSP1437 /ASSEMBLY_ACC=CAM_ASM_001096 /LENGTH=768 /DNA_ID=CAMNT_0043423841 /DNA_START=53 /DNA_END=2360 /DNA_ORIENTATION=+
MSRRRGEFEHRTSIFEGAFRAWSHLGGLEPSDFENKSAADLDPLTNPLLDKDTRFNKRGTASTNNANNKNSNNKNENKKSGGCCGGGGGDQQEGGDSSGDDNNNNIESGNDDGNDNADNAAVGASASFSFGGRQDYPYEPLPRSGLSHPFVQAILSPWLGPDADQEAIQLGLTTLRTWWQHRRKGESGSAITALGTERMRGVVEGYTRHFFNLAHCLVTNDGEQPPRTLHAKIRQLEKTRSKNGGKKNKQKLNIGGRLHNDAEGTPATNAEDPSQLSSNLSPLERLHAAQRRQLQQQNGIISSSFNSLKVKAKTDLLPELADPVTTTHSQQSPVHHQGESPSSAMADNIISSPSISPDKVESSAAYGDPNKTPVVFVSENGDIQIAMSIEGLTCAHCVKIVETVLRGCNGKKSPINGLMDAAADRVLNAVLIKIDQSSNAKRIASESARNLALVGYIAKAKEMKIVDMYTPGIRGNSGRKAELSMLSTAFEVVASVERSEVFNWGNPCSCPDNGVLRDDCARHSQMNKRIFEAFDRREQKVSEFIAGCGKNIDLINTARADNSNTSPKLSHETTVHQGALQQSAFRSQQVMAHQNHHDTMIHQNLSSGTSVGNSVDSDSFGSMTYTSATANSNPLRPGRSNSITSWGSNGRYGGRMSITSENTFGRAMSGLSALSIDWENMEDFDINVDHSAHINNGGVNNQFTTRQQGKREDTNGNAAVDETCNAVGEGRSDSGSSGVGSAEYDKASSYIQQVNQYLHMARPGDVQV